MAKKAKRKAVRPEKRNRVELLEVGDTFVLNDGRRGVLTSFLNGGPFGRWLSEDGEEGDFMPIDGALACTREDGLK